MTKLIHIQTSPRGSRSASQAVAARFIESYCAAHPGDTVDTLDLWQTDLPEINGTTLDAAYAVKHGQPHSPEQRHVWQAIVHIADHFKSADKYLVSLPMWNFSIPYNWTFADLSEHKNRGPDREVRAFRRVFESGGLLEAVTYGCHSGAKSRGVSVSRCQRGTCGSQNLRKAR